MLRRRLPPAAAGVSIADMACARIQKPNRIGVLADMSGVYATVTGKGAFRAMGSGNCPLVAAK
jgi:hypothetical protein